MEDFVQPLGDLKAECRALRETVGTAVAGQFAGVVEITGGDRTTFLHNMCTNDIGKLVVGSGCELFLTNVKGKTLAFANVLCQEDSLLVVTADGQAEAVISHLDRYIIREDVELLDRSAEWATLLVAGRESANIIGDLFDVDPPTGCCAHKKAACDGVELSVCAMDQFGEGGFLLCGDRGPISTVAGRLAELGVAGCSTEAAEVVRIESGIPVFGADISEENFPQEVGRDKSAVSFTKGCYLGQETVARIDAIGHVNRLLVGVNIESSSVPPRGATLLASGAQVGNVTSAAFSPRADVVIALAYVKRDLTEPGTKLEVNGSKAQVVELPMPIS
jgi:folate-binding protein YgfZ